MFSRSASIMNIRAGLVAAAIAMVAMVAVSADEPVAVQPKAGEAAPAISLMDQTGKTVNLSDYKGKWVGLLLQEPDAGCTTQAASSRQHLRFAMPALSAGRERDDVESHRSCRRARLAVPMRADATKNRQAYGC